MKKIAINGFGRIGKLLFVPYKTDVNDVLITPFDTDAWKCWIPYYKRKKQRK